MSEIKTTDFSELNTNKLDGFHQIKPEQGTTLDKAKSFVEKLFSKKSDTIGGDRLESELEETIKDYLADVKKNSEYRETIPDKPFESRSIERRSPEENANMREVFNENKAQLKKEWEEKNGIPWPKYEHDVYNSNGRLIRKAGSDYDAHHIKPLCLGGENTASNITPLHAEVHYDSQGVHASGSPFDKMCKMMGVQ